MSRILILAALSSCVALACANEPEPSERLRGFEPGAELDAEDQHERGPEARHRPAVVQIEVLDLSELETELARLGLLPALRVGLDLSDVRREAGDETASAVERALAEGVRLRAIATNEPVSVTLERDMGFGVHLLDGTPAHDARDSRRQSVGISVVPSRALAPGWYSIEVDLDGALAAGLPSQEHYGSYANRRVRDTLVVRFHRGAARPFLRGFTLRCGDPVETFGLPDAGASICQYAASHGGSSRDAPLAPDAMQVRYNGALQTCRPSGPAGDGRRLRGLLCPQPADGTAILIQLDRTGLVDVDGRTPEPVELRFVAGTRSVASDEERGGATPTRMDLSMRADTFGIAHLSRGGR